MIPAVAQCSEQHNEPADMFDRCQIVSQNNSTSAAVEISDSGPMTDEVLLVTHHCISVSIRGKARPRREVSLVD